MRKGFTLAEVLITVAIIGVVASLTVATVFKDFEKQKTVAQLKGFYSTFSRAHALAVAKLGPTRSWDNTFTSNEDTLRFIDTYLVPFLRINGRPQLYGDIPNRKMIYNLNGQRYTYYDGLSSFYKMDLYSGVSIIARLNGAQPRAPELLMYVDTNGNKGPNMIGRDIFMLVYNLTSKDHAGALLPYNYNYNMKRADIMNNSNQFNCNKEKIGSRCVAVIIMDGWKISDDYPW